MAASRPKKVVKITKHQRKFNVGVLMFFIIFIYLVISVVLYFSREHVSIYEVTIQGTITKEKEYTGVILREENVVTTDVAGYVNYYFHEGERAAVGDIVYTLDENGQVSQLLMSESDASFEGVELTSIKKMITNYCIAYNPTEFSSIYDFKMKLEYALLELASLTNVINLESILSENANVGFFQKHTAAQTGEISYFIDGMEALTPQEVTNATFDMEQYSRKTNKSSDLLEVGSPVYKQTLSDNWTIVFPLTEEEVIQYGNKNSLKINIRKDNFTTTGKFSIFVNESGAYGQLDFDRYMVRYISERFLNFEIVEEVEKGLKIPKTAVLEKNFYTIPVEYLSTVEGEEGFYLEVYDANGASSMKFVNARIYDSTDTYYYIDTSLFTIGSYIIKPDTNERFQIGATASLKGVYNVNQGYTVFRQVEIISENEEYYIVRADTNYGLALYDHIILNSKTVKENDPIYQ